MEKPIGMVKIQFWDNGDNSVGIPGMETTVRIWVDSDDDLRMLVAKLVPVIEEFHAFPIHTYVECEDGCGGTICHCRKCGAKGWPPYFRDCDCDADE
jgi:hypothetical protein